MGMYTNSRVLRFHPGVREILDLGIWQEERTKPIPTRSECTQANNG